jgi:hypothetical protein
MPTIEKIKNIEKCKEKNVVSNLTTRKATCYFCKSPNFLEASLVWQPLSPSFFLSFFFFFGGSGV